MKEVISVMRKIFNLKVVNYRSDFSHDVNYINNNSDYSGFFWVPRENGTCIVPLENFTGENLRERIKYLFGYSTRLDILKDSRCYLDHHYKEGREKDFYYYDKKQNKFKNVTYLEAIELLDNHVKRIGV